MNVEILCINEEYMTTTIFTLLASAHGTIFPKSKEEMSKGELSVFLFKVFEEERWHIINGIHLRAIINGFLYAPSLNKPFFIISDPAFTEANKVLVNSICNRTQKGSKICQMYMQSISQKREISSE